jgi:hypothetical protein
MRATFYIHIGVHKTGTKSIQYTLFNNREKLLEHGINYLRLESNHGPALISLLTERPHTYLRNVLRYVDTPEKAGLYNASIKQQLTEELSNNRSRKVVISGEGLSSMEPGAFSRLKPMLDPYADAYRIIAYVRDPYEYANSATLQRVKNGYVLGAADENVPLPDYRKRIGKFIERFGRDNVDIRVFDPRQFRGGSLVADFLDAIGEPAKLAESLETLRANESTSHEAAIILSEINSAFPIHVDGLANRERVRPLQFLLADIPGEKFRIDPSMYLKHEDKVLKDLEWLHETMGRKVFADPVPRPASTPRWSEATVEAIKKLVRDQAQTIRQLQARKSKNAGRNGVQTDLVVPAGLEWLDDAIEPLAPGRAKAHAAVPQFDRETVRSLACLIHDMALTIRKLKRLNRPPKGIRAGQARIGVQ